jgi:quercetin dioxygenase-like cupin family protein
MSSVQYKSKCDLPPPHRHITTHISDGSSIFYTDTSSELPCQPIRDDVDFYLAYTTSNFPVEMGADDDILQYRAFLEGEKPGLTNKGGSVLRICNFAPNVEKESAAMHRTISIDYGIVTHGEMECWLDSGEKRCLKAGDIVIQRETNHAWRNPSKDKWARIVFILLEAKPLTIGSVEAKEDYGVIQGVRSSS